MLEYIHIIDMGGYFLCALSWDNNYIHPDFATVAGSEINAFRFMAEKISKDERGASIVKAGLMTVPIVLTKIRFNKERECPSHDYWKEVTTFTMCPDCAKMIDRNPT